MLEKISTFCGATVTPILEPRRDVTRSPKQGYQWPHKKGLMSSRIFLKDYQLPTQLIIYMVFAAHWWFQRGPRHAKPFLSIQFLLFYQIND